MADRPTVLAYIHAFRTHVFATMSGGASVPFAALAVFLDNRWAQAIFAALAGTAILFAAYRIWKMEREAVITAETRIAELQATASHRTEKRKVLDEIGELRVEMVRFLNEMSRPESLNFPRECLGK